MLSRLARSLFAATTAAVLLASPAIASAAARHPSAALAAKKDDGGAKDGAKKDAVKGKKVDAKKDDPKSAKAGKLAKKDDAKDKPAKKDDPKKDEPKRDDIKGAASIGAPNKGRLQGAVKLHSSRSLKVREHANAWALPAMVKLLQRAAGKVAKHHARSVMLVGDLSQKTGGSLTGHNSHQSGRDADVGFYISNSKGQPAAMKHFVAFDGAGKSSAVSWAQFDDARNWTLVEALLNDKDTAVRYIFVSSPLRARVLAYASKKKVAKDLYTKAESVLMAPRDADVHDDHFHVRITCPDTMKAFCTEESVTHGGAAAPVAKAGDTKAAPDAAKAAAPDAKAEAAPDAPKAAASDARSAPASEPAKPAAP